jgi:hypothetical protein
MLVKYLVLLASGGICLARACVHEMVHEAVGTVHNVQPKDNHDTGLVPAV